MKRPVRIVDYTPHWSSLYKKEKREIHKVVGHIIVRVEHIGSTAVRNLGAKPIIDIMVGVSHLSDADKCIEPLESIGYEYVSEYEESMPERRYFTKVNHRRNNIITCIWWSWQVISGSDICCFVTIFVVIPKLLKSITS